MRISDWSSDVCSSDLSLPAAGPASAAGEGPALPQMDWSFSGPFGTYDRHALQRGLQVYREVCSTCHSLKYVAFRHLADLVYTEDAFMAMEAAYRRVELRGGKACFR